MLKDSVHRIHYPKSSFLTPPSSTGPQYSEKSQSSGSSYSPSSDNTESSRTIVSGTDEQSSACSGCTEESTSEDEQISAKRHRHLQCQQIAEQRFESIKYKARVFFSLVHPKAISTETVDFQHFHRFFWTMMNSIPTSNEVVAIAGIYLFRLGSKNLIKNMGDDNHIVMMCIALAAKYHDDCPFMDSVYYRFMNDWTSRPFKKLEMKVLFALGYNLNVNLREYAEMRRYFGAR